MHRTSHRGDTNWSCHMAAAYTHLCQSYFCLNLNFYLSMLFTHLYYSCVKTKTVFKGIINVLTGVLVEWRNWNSMDWAGAFLYGDLIIISNFKYSGPFDLAVLLLRTCAIEVFTQGTTFLYQDFIETLKLETMHIHCRWEKSAVVYLFEEILLSKCSRDVWVIWEDIQVKVKKKKSKLGCYLLYPFLI